MAFKSLRSQILLAFIGLITVCQCVAFVTLYTMNADAQQERTQYHLQTAKSVFEAEFEQRGRYLEAFVETAAQDFGLKQVIAEDRRSFLVALNNHRQRIDADIAIAVNKSGRVFGQLIVEPASQRVRVGEETDLLFRYPDLLNQQNANLYYGFDERVFQLHLVPVRAGADVIAWLGFGFAVDSELARHLSAMTGMTTNFLMREAGEWTRFADSDTNTIGPQTQYADMWQAVMTDTATNYVAQTIPIGEMNGTQLVALLFDNRSDFLGTLQERWVGVMLLFASTVLVSFVAAFVLAKRIVQPLRALVQQAKSIASGEQNDIIEVERKDELGQLATEFSIMQQAVAEREEEIRYRACHTDVTKLPNRQQLDVDLPIAMSQNSSLVLMRFRLTDYDEINYSLGSDIGEELQLSVAKRIEAGFPNVVLYQLAAYEFAILIPAEDDIALLTQQLEMTFQNLCSLHLTTLSTHMVGGFSIYPQHGQMSDVLIHNAGIALQQALKKKLPSLEFQTEMAADALSRVQLTHDLTQAIESSELVLFYQPKLDLRSKQVSRCEALVRWQHPTRGMVPPDAFIGIAESTGQINALTDWVLEAAINQLVEWRQQGIDMVIAVNISAENLKQDGFHLKVADRVKKANLPTSAISLEITESALMDDPEGAIAMLEALQGQGFSLSIDDYGTGYSSLSQLKNMPVDELKVDKAFVSEVIENRADQTICSSTIELAHQFGLSVVAEGVETAEALTWLEDLDCEYVQGYYISRPVPAAEFISWLRSSGYSPILPQQERG
ncbi:putative bifunctional diguanylate cyclase/phosphodiesterase [Thaumasiovibrio subtropicus]|uniref:putative bifunctional diguanylate cyclase/phosphodiesterase n=1 Tax=Thaumasiovibrio subtropicus TaxID=1891207 RepID=UPI000B3518D4|nr:GGDEF domain-containing phosphodiesterase [Thaumasiovibrio subtropicus]